MLLKDDVKRLENISYEGAGKVFSLYLNVDPRDPEQQGDKWKIKLKNALSDLAKATKHSDSHEEKNQAKMIREKVEDEVYGKANRLKRGLVLFATANEDVWFSQDLNIPVTTEFHWDNRPHVSQLKNLIDNHPYAGILVIQQEQAQLIETEMGVVLETSDYQLDLDTDEWRLHQGPQGDDWTQGGIKRDEYEERVEAHQQRWLKNLAETIQKQAKKRGWEQFHLVGEKEEVEQFKTYYNRKIDQVIPRNLLGKNPSHIIADTMEA